MYRLIILGAGFSRPAGLPLGDELFEEIIAEAKRDSLFTNILAPQLERYALFVERTTGRSKSVSDITLEPFMSFLDVEHSLGFHGSDAFSEDGDKAQLLVRFLIAKVLYRRQCRMSKDALALYDSFVERLQPDDWIQTFNYDTIVEDALMRAGKPFRLVPARYKSVDEFGATYFDEPDHEIVLLKMHGSIDWFRNDRYRRNRAFRRRAGFTDRPRDAVFNNPRARPRRLVRGPYWRNNPLKRTYRVLNMDAFFDEAVPMLDTPIVISPSFSKMLYLKPLDDFWRDTSSIGSLNGTLAIIGYSLPSYDDYVLQALYAAIRNFQHYDAGDFLSKTNIRFVDFRQTDAERKEYFERYRFVDWSRADTWFDGFSRESLEMIFAG